MGLCAAGVGVLCFSRAPVTPQMFFAQRGVVLKR